MSARQYKNRSLVTSALILAACATIVFVSAGTASACPSCRAALAGDASQGDLARGIYYSIMFMMSMPFAIVGTFGFMAYRAVKREQQRLADEQADTASDDDHEAL